MLEDIWRKPAICLLEPASENDFQNAEENAKPRYDYVCPGS